MHSAHALSLALSCISGRVFTSCMVPQDGNTPPLLHIGQLTAGPKHRAGPNEPANKQNTSTSQVNNWRQPSWAPSLQSKANIHRLHFLQCAFTDRKTAKKTKTEHKRLFTFLLSWASTWSFSGFTWGQAWTLKVNTSRLLHTVDTVYTVVDVCTYAALFQTMTSLSSPPDARYRPLLDQRTQLTQAAVQNTKHHTEL